MSEEENKNIKGKVKKIPHYFKAQSCLISKCRISCS